MFAQSFMSSGRRSRIFRFLPFVPACVHTVTLHHMHSYVFDNYFPVFELILIHLIESHKTSFPQAAEEAVVVSVFSAEDDFSWDTRLLRM